MVENAVSLKEPTVLYFDKIEQQIIETRYLQLRQSKKWNSKTTKHNFKWIIGSAKYIFEIE